MFVTRKVPLKSEEAKSAKARAAIDKELSGHRARKTWDESTVREYKDLMRDDSKAEVMTGRIFGILGETNAEAEHEEDRRMKSPSFTSCPVGSVSLPSTTLGNRLMGAYLRSDSFTTCSNAGSLSD